MNDRELLELAAKAAGLKPRDEWAFDEEWGFKVSSGTPPYEWWNPLTDDGDALRLAVKLRMEIEVCSTGVAVRVPQGYKTLVDSEDVDDAYAATRLAIVRAAAEIGKAMK